jgi:uncharacterized protein YggU (UPF0235/DUF167 family)
MTTGAPWWIGEAQLHVRVRVTPRTRKDAVEGVVDSTSGRVLSVRVRAIADKGEANRAAERVLAEWLGIARTSVSLAAGGKSRLKTLQVAGDPAALEKLLRTRLGELA